MNKESSIAILNHLMQRHEDAAQKYREAAAIATDKSIIDFLESLAEHRQHMTDELRQVMENMPPVPMPVSTRVRSFLYDNWGAFREQLLLKNRKQIASLCQKSESSISDYYRQALSQKGIPMSIHNMLKRQHQHILDILVRVQRMEKVPMLRNNSF